ncbi:hypothetical protein [Brasilonema sp. UFV-L1]|uniref:hypothetical protein n=1 Tax=Brasilonema sp. UFV-L1 TaxID=2234130 RepID=UPI0030D8B55A
MILNNHASCTRVLEVTKLKSFQGKIFLWRQNLLAVVCVDLSATNVQPNPLRWAIVTVAIVNGRQEVPMPPRFSCRSVQLPSPEM